MSAAIQHKSFRLKKFKVVQNVAPEGDADADDVLSPPTAPSKPAFVLREQSHIRMDVALQEISQQMEVALGWWERAERSAIERKATGTTKGKRTVRHASNLRSGMAVIRRARLMLARMASAGREDRLLDVVLRYVEVHFPHPASPWKVISPYKDSDPRQQLSTVRGRLKLLTSWELMLDIVEYDRMMRRVRKAHTMFDAGGNRYFNREKLQVAEVQVLDKRRPAVVFAIPAPIAPRKKTLARAKPRNKLAIKKGAQSL